MWSLEPYELQFSKACTVHGTPNFSNLRGKRKLVHQRNGQFEKWGVKLRSKQIKKTTSGSCKLSGGVKNRGSKNRNPTVYLHFQASGLSI